MRRVNTKKLLRYVRMFLGIKMAIIMMLAVMMTMTTMMIIVIKIQW